MRKIITALALAALPLTIAATAATAAVHPLTGDGPQCNELAAALCWYANGTSGHQVFAHTFSGGAGETFSVTGQAVCTKANGDSTKFVQDGTGGDGPICPWANTGIGRVNAVNTDHDLIVTQSNDSSGLCNLSTTGSDIDQGSCSATGHLWIQASPSDNAAGYWVYMGVVANDASNLGGECSNGVNNALVQSSDGFPKCEWTLT